MLDGNTIVVGTRNEITTKTGVKRDLEVRSTYKVWLAYVKDDVEYTIGIEYSTIVE